MEKSVIVAGFGGQGVMVIGQLLGYTASETTDMRVSFFPSYGAEQRGGTANCYVVISDDEIGAPKVAKADYLIILNQPSVVKFKDNLVKGGTVFVNSSIVTDTSVFPEGTKVIEVPAGEIAADIGNDKVMNLIMIGALIGYSELLPAENVLQTAYNKLGKKRPQLNPLNKTAFERGVEIGKANK